MKPLSLLLVPLLVISSAFADPLIVAHRGASAKAPENTLAAFQEAWDQGADAIEGDFRLTKDGQVVTMHDGTTRRTTGKNLAVAKTNWADLKSLDAGSWKGKQWEGEKIPLLSEVLAAMPKGKEIFVEVKCGPEIVPALFKTIARSQVSLKQVTVIAFNKEVIRAVKKYEAGVTANWLCGIKKNKQGSYSPDLKTIIATLKDIGADGIGAQAVETFANDLGAELRKHGLGYHVWTINSGEMARKFVAAGAHSVTTDQPAKVRASLSAKKAAK